MFSAEISFIIVAVICWIALVIQTTIIYGLLYGLFVFIGSLAMLYSLIKNDS